jgi:hypothetical protein
MMPAEQEHPKPLTSETPEQAATADYYRKRERKERAAAKHAASVSARAVHQELAQSYAQLITRTTR